jgi:hypothetical protein
MKKESLNTNKETGFKTPEDYFKSFETLLSERIEFEETMRDIDRPGFTIPKDYFNSIEDSVMKKLSKTEDKTPVIKVTFKRSLYYISGIAASLLLLIAIFINKEETLEISVDMVETHFETQGLDSYELAELLVDAELLDDNFTIANSAYNETNLETYLLENADFEVFIE